MESSRELTWPTSTHAIPSQSTSTAVVPDTTAERKLLSHLDSVKEMLENRYDQLGARVARIQKEGQSGGSPERRAISPSPSGFAQSPAQSGGLPSTTPTPPTTAAALSIAVPEQVACRGDADSPRQAEVATDVTEGESEIEHRIVSRAVAKARKAVREEEDWWHAEVVRVDAALNANTARIDTLSAQVEEFLAQMLQIEGKLQSHNTPATTTPSIPPSSRNSEASQPILPEEPFNTHSVVRLSEWVLALDEHMRNFRSSLARMEADWHNSVNALREEFAEQLEDKQDKDGSQRVFDSFSASLETLRAQMQDLDRDSRQSDDRLADQMRILASNAERSGLDRNKLAEWVASYVQGCLQEKFQAIETRISEVDSKSLVERRVSALSKERTAIAGPVQVAVAMPRCPTDPALAQHAGSLCLPPGGSVKFAAHIQQPPTPTGTVCCSSAPPQQPLLQPQQQQQGGGSFRCTAVPVVLPSRSESPTRPAQPFLQGGPSRQTSPLHTRTRSPVLAGQAPGAQCRSGSPIHVHRPKVWQQPPQGTPPIRQTGHAPQGGQSVPKAAGNPQAQRSSTGPSVQPAVSTKLHPSVTGAERSQYMLEIDRLRAMNTSLVEEVGVLDRALRQWQLAPEMVKSPANAQLENPLPQQVPHHSSAHTPSGSGGIVGEPQTVLRAGSAVLPQPARSGGPFSAPPGQTQPPPTYCPSPPTPPGTSPVCSSL